MHTDPFNPGNYRFIPAVSQYSGGVTAQAGWRIERARFSGIVPQAAGFERIAQHLASLGRPNSAFCACELRSPAPFTEAGFRDFNAIYIKTLERWGLMRGDVNPVARSNVCPAVDPPPEPGFHAFCRSRQRWLSQSSLVSRRYRKARRGQSHLLYATAGR